MEAHVSVVWGEESEVGEDKFNLSTKLGDSEEFT